MQAIDVMSRDLVTVSPSDTVQDAARVMLKSKVSGLPVVDDKGALVGIVSEGDLLHRVENDTDRLHSLLRQMFTPAAHLKSEFVKSTGRVVKDVMTPHPITVGESTLLADIAEIFDRNRIKRVPVVQDNVLIGIVSRADLLRALVGFGGGRPGDLRVVDFS
jgi:CBS domain-containing protein